MLGGSFKSDSEEDIAPQWPRRRLRHSVETGAMYTAEPLAADNERFQPFFHISKDVFLALVDELQSPGLLRSRTMSIEEHILILLYIVTNGVTFRNAAQIFQHSIAGISRTFQKVFKVVLRLARSNIK